MVVINDVARLAGVSTATVSKYLNGIRVRQHNAAAIDSAVYKLGYVPNEFARGLRTNRSMTIGVLLPELDNLFFTSIISSVDSVLEKNGYITLVCISRSDIERESVKLDFLMRKKIDGLIVIPCSSASDFNTKLDDLPAVFIDRIISNTNFDCVLLDNYNASYKSAEKLINSGHRRIGILLGPAESYTPIERLNGFLAAYTAHSVEIVPELIRSGAYNIETGYKMTRDLLNLPEPPTAIYATNNELTIGCVKHLNECGITPGKNISFIGFDNLTLAQSVYPRLTVVVQPVDEIGKMAANILLTRISGEAPSGVIRLDATLYDYDTVINIK